MKKRIHIFSFLKLAICAASLCIAQDADSASQNVTVNPVNHELQVPIVVPTGMTINTSGNGTISATSALTAATSNSTTGNAATATALQTPRNINGVAFDGTANISLPAVNLSISGSGGVTGNLPVINLDSGSGADGTKFWRGDGTWAAGPISGPVTSFSFPSAHGNVGVVTNANTTPSLDLTLLGGLTPTALGLSASSGSASVAVNVAGGLWSFTAGASTGANISLNGFGLTLVNNSAQTVGIFSSGAGHGRLTLNNNSGTQTIALTGSTGDVAAATFTGNLTSGMFANPTGSVSTTATNGTATTAMRSDAAPAIDLTMSPNMTGQWAFRQDGIATTPAQAVNIANGTAATALIPVQISPFLNFTGSAWKSNATAASRQHDWRMQVLPVAGTATTTSGFIIANQVNGGGYTTDLTLNSDQSATFAGNVSAPSLTLSTTPLAIASGGTGQTSANAAFNALAPSQTSMSGNYLTTNGTNASWAAIPAGLSGANPTASVGLTAVNGSASTFLRSDGAPALNVAISPVWTGNHTFSSGNVTLGSGNPTAVVVANDSLAVTTSGNGSATITPSGTGIASLSSLQVIPTTLATPNQVSVTASGSNNGAVNYRYKCQAFGAGYTAASATMTNPFAGNSILDGTHINILSVAAVPNAVQYAWYRISPNTLTTGYIGSSSTPTFNDTGLTASLPTGATVTLPSTDGGSAGVYLPTGPLVIVPTGSTTGDFGGLQMADTPMVIPAGDTYGYDGPMAAFISSTPSGTNRNNALLLQAANSNNPGIVFRYSNGSALKPVAQGAGEGWIASEAYITDIAAWRMATYSEFGSSGATATTSSLNFGRKQDAVAHGEAAGTFTRLGTVLDSRATYTSPLNAVAFIGTNFLDVRLHRVGLPDTASIPDATNYERVDGTWPSAGTTFNWGPVAGGTGTLRALKLTGSLVSTDNNLTVGGGTLNSPTSVDLTLQGAAGSSLVLGSNNRSGTFNGNSGSSMAFNVVQAGTGEVDLVLNRTSGTTSAWTWYLPSGSTDLRLYNSGDKFTMTTAGNATVAGSMTVGGNVTFTAGNSVVAASGNNTLTLSGTGTGVEAFTNPARLPSYTVATLPSAVTSGAFAMASVTDALGPVIGVLATGGGTVKAAVMSNGATWTVFAIP